MSMPSSKRSSKHGQSDSLHPQPYPVPPTPAATSSSNKPQQIAMGQQRRAMHTQWIAALQKQVREKDAAYTEISQKNYRNQDEIARLTLAREESEDRLKKLQTAFYDQTKNIKVTDDDFSTIIAKLGKFSGKLSNFPPNSKSSFKKTNSKQQVIDFFLQHVEEREKKHVLFLFEQEQDKDKWDYALISVLVEKLIAQEIVDTIYKAPIHLNPQVNNAFLEIEKLYKSSGHDEWIKDLRLKMSKATFDLINTNNETNKTINMETRNSLIDRLVSQLSEIYDGPAEIKSRIEKLVDMAIDLSLPIRGQEDLVKIYELKDTDVPRKNQVKPLYRHFGSNNIVLGISPVFLAHSTVDDEYNNNEEEEEGEDITNTYIPDHTLVYQGKAIW